MTCGIYPTILNPKIRAKVLRDIDLLEKEGNGIIMSMKYSDIKEMFLEDQETKKAYEELEPEYQLIYAMVESRREKNISQQELADVTGINRSDISKIENGNANPSLKTIKRVAKGLGKRVEIRFI